jgi:hypothetical protein
MPGKVGRPLKYGNLLERLEPDRLYSASTIAEFAVSIGYLNTNDPRCSQKMRRIRVSCSQICLRYGFPALGDGTLLLQGQRPSPGWFGWRWIDVVKQKKRLLRKKPSARRKRKRKSEGIA